MKFETVLFDLDGTLIDTKPGIMKSLKFALDTLNVPIPPDETLTLFLGPPLRECFTEVIGLSGPAADRAVQLYRTHLVESGNATDCTVYEGIPKLLRQLSGAGLRLGVATSKATPLAKTVLTGKGIAGCFDAICGAAPENPKAAKVDSIHAALSAVGCDRPGMAVMIGDRRFDAQGALQAGMPSIGVFYGYGSRDEISASRFTYTAESVEDLARLLLTGN